MGIRMELLEKGTEMAMEEGILMGYVREDREKWRIVGVFCEREYRTEIKKSGTLDGG